MFTPYDLSADTPLRQAVRDAIYMDEKISVQTCTQFAKLTHQQNANIVKMGMGLVAQVRDKQRVAGGVDALMQEYSLSTEEGLVLMCLAEALLRIPDGYTQDKLIRDKIGGRSWRNHLGNSPSMFVNTSTWGLILTGGIVGTSQQDLEKDWGDILQGMVRRVGEPVIRQGVRQAMYLIGRQFVMGTAIENAIERGEDHVKRGYRYSYDMLGEGARTDADAKRYMDAYVHAINAIGAVSDGLGPIQSSGVSVKLSALHARYEYGNQERVLNELYPRLLELAQLSAQYDIGLCIDAEEVDRLDLSMTLLEKLCFEPSLKNWQGLGLAVQAYQKRCFYYIDWLADLARRAKKRLLPRLVKGAYWDTEIKRAQEMGLSDFPVFTRKVYTDVSYMACAKKLLSAPDAFYPCFATHNAHTMAMVAELACGLGGNTEFEYQCLHGMGDALYDQIVGDGADKGDNKRPVRIYAPVGQHEDLLAYLVRRLLENGANSSFVNRIVDENVPLEDMVQDPVAQAEQLGGIPHAHIKHPLDLCERNLYGAGRKNSKGIDMTDTEQLKTLQVGMAKHQNPIHASSLVCGKPVKGKKSNVTNPATGETVGTVIRAGEQDIIKAIDSAGVAFETWHNTPADVRATALEKTADLFEDHTAEFMAILTREAGKSLPDGIAEVREAVDFLRYYAQQAREKLSAPIPLAGPTGEINTIQLKGRGVFLCVSPWNFPLAIFSGQIAAALAVGNTVVAKPADTTCILAYRAIQLMHQAGIPTEALHLLCGSGQLIGDVAISHPKLGGVCFTGSTEIAKSININMANRDGAILPLIAETGGQNAMIVDSSALPEQVCRDVISGAFQSAGQRCSALRVLFVQEDVADGMIEMIQGAMRELTMGNPMHLCTDVGPVIDERALRPLIEHAHRMDREATLLGTVDLPKDLPQGSTFFAPRMYELTSLEQLHREVFGPILHVIRFKAQDLETIIHDINNTGYGLTLGIHSRIDATVEKILSKVKVGNAYVNRNQIGAVVGMQPFGGEGLSGTGPKAGGPHYLYRFATEHTVSRDVTAAGGNAALMATGEG